MITLRSTREGLEVKRFLPFMSSGNGEGGTSSSSDFPVPPIQNTEKEVKHGKSNYYKMRTDIRR